MKLIKKSMRVLLNYATVLLIFGVFLYLVLSLAKDNIGLWLSLYSIVIFLLLVLIMYADIKKQAIIEKKPQYALNPFPLKGLVYGLIGFSPVIVIEAVSLLLTFDNETANRINHLALNTILGPLYFIIKAGGEHIWAYAVAAAVVPLLSMLSYMSGYYGINLGKYLGRKPKQGKIPSRFPYNKPVVKNKKWPL